MKYNNDWAEKKIKRIEDLGKMRHRIEIDESQRQMTLLALAKLSNERPGWTTAIEAIAMCFPCGYELFTQFRNIEVEATMEAIGGIGKKKVEIPF